MHPIQSRELNRGDAVVAALVQVLVLAADLGTGLRRVGVGVRQAKRLDLGQVRGADEGAENGHGRGDDGDGGFGDAEDVEGRGVDCLVLVSPGDAGIDRCIVLDLGTYSYHRS